MVFDLSKEVSFEGAKIIDTGVFYALQGEDPKQITSTYLENLTNSYALSRPNSEITIIYGNLEGLYVINSTKESSGSLGLGSGGQTGQQIEITTLEVNRKAVPPPPLGTPYTITIGDNTDLSFTINEKTQNIYVVVEKESQGQTFVALQN
ncbi:hypothetical protein CMI47_04315 [Candidatus Pacearchaeota archaeon]|nr:hypothetical protein [Candidatus Pacearchaeota archaeon]